MSENHSNKPATLWGRVSAFFSNLVAPVVGFFTGIGEKFPRLGDFAIYAIVLALVILLFQPHLLTVTAYKLSLVTLAAWLGYRVDRSVFPYARPHRYIESARAKESLTEKGNLRHLAILAMIRRAIIVAAVILAIALGA